VANTHGELPLQVSVNDRPRTAHSTYSWSAGGRVLTLSTVLPDRDLAVEMISTYVGHPKTPTIATHLILGPVDHPAEIRTAQHEHLNPAENARECAYDHAHQLIKALGAAGHQANVQFDELTFSEIERIE
jgi:hypothetical protein